MAMQSTLPAHKLTSMSSASLSSSFSSAGSSMLLPAAPASNSSQSDIITSDHSASSPSTTTDKPTSLHSRSCAEPRSHPHPSSSMGQAYSRPEHLSSSPASSPTVLGFQSSTTGFRFKHPFSGRRKKTDDVDSPSTVSPRKTSREHAPQSIAVSTSAPPHGSPRPLGPKQLTLQLASHVFSKKHSASPLSVPTSLPPPLPPKTAVARLSAINTNIDKRTSVMTSNSSISAAIEYARRVDERVEAPTAVDRSSSRRDGGEKIDSKESRRKSDSTISHHTVRPGSVLGRSSRPVSTAESLQSTHTIVPGYKRLSSFVTEAENTMPEEDDTESNENIPSRGASHQTSPSSSIRIRNRRSRSLNLGGLVLGKVSAPEVTVATAAASLESIPVHSAPAAASSRELVTADTAGSFVTPSTPIPIRGQFTAAAAERINSTPIRQERNLPNLPPTQRRPSLASDPSQFQPTFRQTAISMSNGFAPAAGLARRAVEKMGRVWGARHTNTNSGYISSSPTGSAPSSYSSAKSGLVSRTSSSQSEIQKKQRRTPQAPSGSWSISSSGTCSSLSDTEGPTGPIMGRRLRGPVRFTPSGAGVAGGLVFGRDLKTCVRDTAIDPRRMSGDTASTSGSQAVGDTARSAIEDSIEARRLPALVVRCAQHIMVWGVQELGLFRVSGRSSHVAKLRAEFDTGADYDLTQCTPGDLDPHAVASIFKAYLRELPEPILTLALGEYFEAAIHTERAQDPQGLSSLPKFGLRKPPSLSTLAMPSFATSAPPSEALRKALSSLIAQLPQENRDLLRTVTDLINATTARSKDTKMPLSNILLVLCPSLNMNPPLLQALCTAEGLWEASLEDDVASDTDDEAIADEAQHERHRENADEEKALPNSGKPSIQSRPADRDTQGVATAGNAERSLRKLPDIPNVGGATTTLYVDCETVDRESRLLCVRKVSVASGVMTSVESNVAPSPPSTDDSSYFQDHRPSTPTSGNFKSSNPNSPPSLSSSAESLNTPSTSSGPPSPPAKHSQLTDEFDRSKPSDSFYSSHISPIITDIRVPLPSTPKKSPFPAQIQFPLTAGENSAPSTPATNRKVVPAISLPSHPNFPQPQAESSNPVGLRAKRMKKPSLHLLFSKRSSSPMTRAASPGVPLSAMSSKYPLSPSTGSSPGSMVTAPQSSRHSFPPILNTEIDRSSLRLSLGIDEDEETVEAGSTGRDDFGPTSQDASVSKTSLATTSETRVAAQFNISSTSLNSFNSETSYRHLNVSISDDDKDEEDDWAHSVLVAADSEGVWRANSPRQLA